MKKISIMLAWWKAASAPAAGVKISKLRREELTHQN